MCTIGFYRNLDIIFKNRDKDVPAEEEIMTTPDFVAVRTKGEGYYSLGVNKFGCGFVSAAINPPEWTRLVEEGKQEQAQSLLEQENKTLFCPTILVSEMLPKVQTIEEWIETLNGFEDDFRGYNIIMVDLFSSKIMETFKQDREVQALEERIVATNHFQVIEFGPKDYEDYPNSFDRYRYAVEALRAVQTLGDVFAMLKPQDNERRRQIWREGHFLTVSTSVVDISNKCLYYAQQPDREYQKITLY